MPSSGITDQVVTHRFQPEAKSDTIPVVAGVSGAFRTPGSYQCERVVEDSLALANTQRGSPLAHARSY